MLHFQRYLRLTPLLAVLILIAMSLYRFIGSGPIWPSIFNDLKVPCDRKWWQALLYIKNYVDSEYMVSFFVDDHNLNNQKLPFVFLFPTLQSSVSSSLLVFIS